MGGSLMKNDFENLIDQLEHIRSLFKTTGGNGKPQINKIYDNAEFSIWKQEIQLELEGIHDRTKDKFIWDTLVNLKQGFNGWKDEYSFNELSGSLLAIRKNIDTYYPVQIEVGQNTKEVSAMSQKRPKVFISHSSEDKDYVACLVDFLEDIGLTQEHLFCSSVSGYGIPLDEDIYDYLKQQFSEHNLHVILVLSENYYNSVACMNEMGAAWILQNKYTTILLPGFEFKEIKGAINPRRIGLKLDADPTEVKEKLGQLKDVLSQEFELPQLNDIRWERKRDNFITAVSQKRITVPVISDEALSLLKAACEATDGTILKISTLSGTSIVTNGQDFITSQERREVAKWEGALEELLRLEFIQVQDRKGEVFAVSKCGYDYLE